CNFEVTDLYLAYGEQYLLIETQPVSTPSEIVHPREESLEELAELVKHFSANINQKLYNWKQQLQQMKTQDKKVVVWGSGSKCVAFLTTLGVTDQVDYIVDINPHRHGKFIPGVGKEIMSPEFLKDYEPDVVIVMNAIYCPEIQKMLDKMGVVTEVMPI
ncbi:MAG: hypothetical protein WBF52_03435, partial [Geitlerinemataceae cyanobacterium]